MSARAAEEWAFALIIVAIVAGIVLYHWIDTHTVANQISACHGLPTKALQATCIHKVAP